MTKFIRNDKVPDYHDMLSHIFKEMNDIRDSSGMILTLDFGMSYNHQVATILVI